jgi:hypothetical protein
MEDPRRMPETGSRVCPVRPEARKESVMRVVARSRRGWTWMRAVIAMALVSAFVLMGQQSAEAWVAAARGAARRTSRRTTRRVVRRHLTVLPAGYRTIVRGGVTYFYVGGVYYKPVIQSGQTVYVVVTP